MCDMEPQYFSIHARCCQGRDDRCYGDSGRLETGAAVVVRAVGTLERATHQTDMVVEQVVGGVQSAVVVT